MTTFSREEETILKLASGESDEHKVAALTLTTRLLPKDRAPSERFLVRLHESLGSSGDFLRRLLSSPASECSSAALSVASALGTAPSVASSDGLLWLVAPVLSLACSPALPDPALDDAMCFLESLAATQAGSRRLLSDGVLAAMPRCSEQRRSALGQCLHVIRSVVRSCPPPASLLAAQGLPPLCLMLAQREDSSKFDLLETVAALLASVEADDRATDEWRNGPWQPWQEQARAAVASVLTSKVGPRQRAHALQLAACAMELCGERWAVAPWSSPTPAAGCERVAGSITPAKFVGLLVSASAVEVRVSLGDHSLMSSPDKAEAFACGLRILERSASYLATDDEEGGDAPPSSWWWRELNAESLLLIRKIHIEALNDAIEFLESSAEKDSPPSPVISAAARFAFSWVTLDPDGPIADRLAPLDEYLAKVSAF